MVASQALTRLCVANGWQWGRMRGGWKGPVPWKFEWIWNQVKKTHIYIIYLPFEHWTMSPSLIVQSWFVKCLQRSVKSMHINAMFWHILEGIPWDSNVRRPSNELRYVAIEPRHVMLRRSLPFCRRPLRDHQLVAQGRRHQQTHEEFVSLL